MFSILDLPPGDEPPLEEAYRVYTAASRERIEGAITRCFEDGTPFALDLELDTYAGRRIPVRCVGEAERGPDGTIERVVGAFQDISDLHDATRRAERATERLALTLESMTDAIYTIDNDWRFTYLNERAEQLLRRTGAELLGEDLWEQFPDAIESPLHPVYHRALVTGDAQHIEEFYFPPLETWFSVDVYPSEQGLAVYFRDVTAAHDARVALERQAMLLDAAQDAITVRDLDHRITSWHRGAERCFGWPPDEALGRDARERLYEDPAVFDRAVAAVLCRGTWIGEARQRTRDGDVLTVAARWTLLSDEAGRPEAILAIETDTTEQKQVEQQLLRAQRMESIGTLAGGVAHDLNNVLSPVLLAAELLRTTPAGEDRDALLDIIESSATRGSDLVGQVLSFARGVEGDRVPVDVAALVHDIGAIVRDTFPKKIRLELAVPDDLGTAVGDSTQIQQVLLNLAVNARDAMPTGGVLRITAEDVELAAPAATSAGLDPGPYLVVEVEDDGTGMSPTVRERIFEPFFTTKEQGAGTGLGLSTVAAIVRSHGGAISVDSEPGRGSRFRLHLPRPLAGDPADAPADDAAGAPQGRGQTVLVVDDEQAVRTMTRRTLEANGYAVLEAADGAEALATYVEHRDRIDVVLTDMMMPIMDGPATIRALRRLDPDVRVLAASGLHDDATLADAEAAGVGPVLAKPFTSRTLLDAVDRTLHGPPTS